MKRTIDIERTYNCSARKAIGCFFRYNSALDSWKEVFEWMIENHLETYSDIKEMGSNWTYSLHLYEDDGITTICIVERA